MTRGSQTPICKCDAYPFPHRWGAGKCDKWDAVEQVAETAVSCQGCQYQIKSTEPHGETTFSCFLLENQEYQDPKDCTGISTVVTNLE